MHEDAPLFALFWEGSTLNRRTERGFAARLDEDARAGRGVPQLHYPEALALPTPDDPLARLMATRRSRRSLVPAPLSIATLGSLLRACARSEQVRANPSAGATHPIETFAFLFSAAAPFDRTVVSYASDTHALCRVGPCPPYSVLAPEIGLQLDGEPAALVVLTGWPDRIVPRYGERAGRFLLIEAGHHAQGLALRAAHEGLAGVLAGGLHDEAIKSRLGLADTSALIVLGFALGAPAPERSPIG